MEDRPAVPESPASEGVRPEENKNPPLEVWRVVQYIDNQGREIVAQIPETPGIKAIYRTQVYIPSPTGKGMIAVKFSIKGAENLTDAYAKLHDAAVAAVKEANEQIDAERRKIVVPHMDPRVVANLAKKKGR